MQYGNFNALVCALLKREAARHSQPAISDGAVSCFRPDAQLRIRDSEVEEEQVEVVGAEGSRRRAQALERRHMNEMLRVFLCRIPSNTTTFITTCMSETRAECALFICSAVSSGPRFLCACCVGVGFSESLCLPRSLPLLLGRGLLVCVYASCVQVARRPTGLAAIY